MRFTLDDKHLTKWMRLSENRKLSCRRETVRRFVSLNILLSHSRSFEVTLLR